MTESHEVDCYSLPNLELVYSKIKMYRSINLYEMYLCMRSMLKKMHEQYIKKCMLKLNYIDKK